MELTITQSMNATNVGGQPIMDNLVSDHKRTIKHGLSFGGFKLGSFPTL